ncbi:unnamed protein product [Amoebophrya sp. A120]|nr:unnamed protein product [Amoebophrya sp. A120]|eukprot:GSA120T00014196001.1
MYYIFYFFLHNNATNAVAYPKLLPQSCKICCDNFYITRPAVEVVPLP